MQHTICAPKYSRSQAKLLQHRVPITTIKLSRKQSTVGRWMHTLGKYGMSTKGSPRGVQRDRVIPDSKTNLARVPLVDFEFDREVKRLERQSLFQRCMARELHPVILTQNTTSLFFTIDSTMERSRLASHHSPSRSISTLALPSSLSLLETAQNAQVQPTTTPRHPTPFKEPTNLGTSPTAISPTPKASWVAIMS